MKQLKIKADKEFVKLYNEAEKFREKITESVSEKIGYAGMWVEKHFTEAMEKIKPEDKKPIDKLIFKANTIKQYAWALFYYKNIERIPEDSLPPKYNPETKMIEFPNPKLLEKFMEQAKKLISKMSKKSNG